MKIPDVPGVYFFIAPNKEILYIGKATSLRDRVKSYFKDDVIQTRGPLIVDMVTRATTIEWVKTDSVLEAVILEANEIKKYQPTCNTKEKDDKSFNYVVFTDEDFPTILLVRGKDIEAWKATGKAPVKIKWLFGPYPQGSVLKEALKIIRRIFPYRDQKCVPCSEQIEKLKNRLNHTVQKRHPNILKNVRMSSAAEESEIVGCKQCFARQIGLCPGVCTGEISKEEYRKQIRNIKIFFEGRKHELVQQLEKEMKECAKRQEFEKAGEIKRTIFSLTHIKDVTLIKAEDKRNRHGEEPGTPHALFRIEGYDIAHMSGQNTGGVMVVYEDGHIKKSDYRLFKIRRTKGVNDIAGLKEVLDRRLNHTEWTFPNLIVVDGGAAQKNAAEALLRERGFDIAVVSVVKDDRHKPLRILGDGELAEKYKKEILLLNSEAHRFAIKYHRKRRGRLPTD